MTLFRRVLCGGVAAVALVGAVGGVASGASAAASTTAAATTAVSASAVGLPGPEAARLRTSVFLSRTGGFVGANDRITITRSGAWVHRDLRTGAVRTGQLKWWQIQQLNRLLDRAYGTKPGQAPRGCADAFRFTLVAGGLRASYEECGQRVGPVGDVVQFILRAVAS